MSVDTGKVVDVVHKSSSWNKCKKMEKRSEGDQIAMSQTAFLITKAALGKSKYYFVNFYGCKH